MTREKNGNMRDWMVQNFRVVTRLAPWFFGFLLLSVLFGGTDLTATTGLFQSPQDTPTPELATPIPIETPELLPTETEMPIAEPTLEPTETPGPTETATELPPPTETAVAPTDTPPPPPTSTPEPALPEDGGRYAEGEANLRFDWTMLFDSLALGLAYVWLFCGILLFLIIPFFFFILWLATRRRQQQGRGEEG
jgi:hypothetical protein